MFNKKNNEGDRTPKSQKQDSSSETATKEEKPAIVAGDGAKPAADDSKAADGSAEPQKSS